MRGTKLRLGEILLRNGKINEEQLEIAIEVQRKKKKKLGQTLIDLDYIDQSDIIDALEHQLGIGRVKLENVKIDPEIPKLIDEQIARKYDLIPYQLENMCLYVAMADPMDILSINEIEMITGYEVIQKIASKELIERTIDKYYSTQMAEQAVEDFTEELGLGDINREIDKEILNEINKAPVVRLVNTIINQAASSNASDIHIEPGETYLRIRFRVDGDLREIMKPAKETHGAIVTRIKIMAEMNIAEKRKPQDGRIKLKFHNKDLDLRVSSIPTIHGEKIVMRVQDRYTFLKSIDDLGFTDKNKEIFKGKINAKNGIILITGPTGSGKSTTMYSILDALNDVKKNIITIEDPVEYQMDGIIQSQVNEKAGYDFPDGLRSMLRQDPDVIMVGEIRDRETAQISTRAAITGHLVLSTLHTNTALSTVNRLIDMGIKPYMLAGSLKMVVSQLLVKRICPECQVPYFANDSEKDILEVDRSMDVEVFRGTGCSHCNNTGYFGRIPVHEILVVDSRIKNMVLNNVGVDKIEEYLIHQGQSTLIQNAEELVYSGKTTVEELLEVKYAREV